MRRSRIIVPLHLVWATYQRMPLVTTAIEEPLYRCIGAEAAQLDVEVLAIGGLEDHIHVAVMFPATVTISRLVQRLKGVSSHIARTELLPEESFFRWQEGYSASGFHTNLITQVVGYVQNQKQRHEAKNLWPELEKVDEETPPQ